MARFVIQNEPFAARSAAREIPVEAGRTVQDLLDAHWPHAGVEPVVLLNREFTDDYSTVISEGDVIFTCPNVLGSESGKRAAATFAQIALTVGIIVAPWAAPLKFIAGVTGSLLINSFVKSIAKDNLGSDESSLEIGNTYGWRTGDNRSDPSQVIPILYGTMKYKPPLIASFISYNDENEQEINLLYALTEGQIEDLKTAADPVTGDPSLIQINGQAITAYESICGAGPTYSLYNSNVHVRTGLASQLVSPGFSDVKIDTSVAAELVDNTHVTRTTTSDQVQAFGIGIIFNRGLYTFNKENGNIDPNSVSISYRYRESPAGAWSVTTTKVITDSDQRATRRFFPVNNLPAAQYDIDVWVSSTRPTADEDYIVEETYFEFFQEAIAGEYTYPGLSTLAIKALASKDLNGSLPVVEVMPTRAAFDNGASNNPAWVCYDMLTNTSYGGGVPTASVTLQDFQDWADWCDNPASTPVAHSLQFNAVIDTPMNVADSLQYPGAIGRGSVVYRGTKFSTLFDGVAEPSQVFTIGNISAESFTGSFTGSEDLANTLEVTFFDADAGYTQKSVEVQTDDFDSTTDPVKKNQVNAIGVTSFDQAKRMAQYLLNVNRYINRSITFTASADAIAVRPGDVVSIQHDIPQWGYGGRVVSATSNSITVDRGIPTELATVYAVVVRDDSDDSLETVYLNSPGAGTYSTFTLQSGTWARTPGAGDVYSLGVANLHVKDFRVLAIRKKTDLLCEIEAAEYREEVYDDAVDIPEYRNQSDLPKVAGVRGDDVFITGNDGQVRQANIEVTWRGFAFSWVVAYKDDTANGVWRTAGPAYTNRFTIPDVEVGHTYTIAVYVPGSGSVYGGDVDYDTVLVSVDPPDAVTNLTAETIDNFVTLKWRKPNSELPISHYEIRKGATFATAPTVGRADKTFTTFFELESGTYTYWVYAVDTAGNQGTEASVSVTLSLPSDYQQPTNFTDGLDGTGTNMVVETGLEVSGPIDTTETWQEHFANNGFADIQDAIDAGYTYYFEPGPYPLTGSYETNEFDFGATFAKATAILKVEYDTLVGSSEQVNIVPTISLAASSGGPYTDYENVWQKEGTNFRYAKATLDITTDGNTVIKITSVKFVLYLKKYRESGMGNVSVAATGKFVEFVYGFADVSAITVSPAGDGSVARSMVFDFTDVPNPTGFTAYILDENGDKTTGNFSYQVEGV